MGPSKNHHYVPCFYLKRWSEDPTNKPALVWGGGISADGRFTPWPVKMSVRRIAVAKNLNSYSYPMMPDEMKRETEQYFEAQDEAAAAVLRKLIAKGPEELTKFERSTWAKFINGLLRRSKYNLNAISEQLKALAPGIFDDMRRIPAPDPKSRENMESFLALMEENVESAMMYPRLNIMAQSIEDPVALEELCVMKWSVVRDPKGRLVTSDRPVVVDYGIDTDVTCIVALALDPERLMVLEHPRYRLADDDRQRMVEIHLKAMLCNRPRQIVSFVPLERAAIQPLLDDS